MEILMRCQSYLASPNPPDECCQAVGYALNHKLECVCHMVYSDAMLLYLNVTFMDLLSLPGRCGLSMPDLAICATFGIAPLPLFFFLPYICAHANIQT